ncbi:MAG: SctF chaperone SctG [Verrucomicrobia bacterium]|nr:SctF chaperone SctG [Verrucomicrobiota bacterium]
MGHLQNFKDDFILMAEAGFIAINQMDEDAALKLFKASETLEPKNSLWKTGVGYMHLCKLELKQAVKVFEDLISQEPDNEMAKTFLGLSLSLNPTELAKGEKVLTEACGAKDPMVKSLAENALDFVNKFVKKAPSPMEKQPTSDKKKK